jgi:hypothetical protein
MLFSGSDRFAFVPKFLARKRRNKLGGLTALPLGPAAPFYVTGVVRRTKVHSSMSHCCIIFFAQMLKAED